MRQSICFFIAFLLINFKAVESFPLNADKAILDLIDTGFTFSEPVSRSCNIVLYNLPEDLASRLLMSSPSVTFWSVSGNASDHSVQTLHSNVFCVIVVAQTDANFDDIQRLIIQIKHRKMMILSSSLRATMTIPLQKMKTYGLILNEASLPGSFNIHATCPDCMLPQLPYVDFWTQNGLTRPINYFKMCCFGKNQLFGQTITVSVYGTPPYIIVNADRTQLLGGIDIDILIEMAKKFLFRPAIRPEGDWSILVDGEWTPGTIRSVARGDSQIGVGHIPPIFETSKVVDFSSILYFLELSHLSNVPKPLEPFSNVIWPFQAPVWTGLCLIIILVGVVFSLIHYVHETFHLNNENVGTIKNPADFILLTASILVNQDGIKWFGNFSRWNSSGSILEIFWAITCVIFTLSYISNLRASLIVISYEKPINSMQDVVDTGNIVYYPSNSQVIQNLKTSPLKIFRDLYSLAEDKGGFYRFEGNLPIPQMDAMYNSGKGVLGVSRDNFLYGYKYIKDTYPAETIAFRMAKENFFTAPTCFVVSKNMLWLDDVNVAMTGLVEFGIVQHFTTKNTPTWLLLDRFKSKSKVSSVPKRLELITLLSSMMFLVLMLIISSIIFMVERCMKKYQK